MKKTRRKLPNLKTKLFGTIVAIVSVIAVMGVGVLASADSFTVSVTNSVNIAFYNLSGTVSVSAEAGADDLAAEGPKLDETTLYSAGTTTYSTISIADTAGQNLKYSGAEFLKTEGGGVTEQTKAGVVAYTFKYTPVSTDETAGSLKVMLNEEAKPSMSGASLVTAYFVSLDGNNWAEIQSKSAVVPAKDNVTLYVLAVCQYLNPQGLAAKSDQTAWKFALTMWSSPESVSALTYSNALPELADGVTDGVVLGEDYTPTPDEEEFVYELSEDGNYIYFGEYPQTLKAADVTLSTEPMADGYYLGSDGERYYEYTIGIDFETMSEQFNANYNEETWSSMDQLDASTGEEMVNGGTYYFEMEKIKWRILDEVDGTYTIVADTNLQALVYQPTYTQDGSNYYTTANGAPEGTYANNYKYSELRRFLNNDFMDFAFSEEQKALIQKNVEVDNSLASTGEETNPYVCENTFDDVWALSVEDVYTHIGEAESDALSSWIADLETSDFSRATGATTYTRAFITDMMGEEYLAQLEALIGTGVTWLRSPYSANSIVAYGVVYGGIDGSFVDDPNVGVLPALQLDLSAGGDEEFVYEISEDGQYIYFGEYPQTLKAANVTVAETPDADGYFLGSDGERYYEYTINLDLGDIEEMWMNTHQLDASTGEEMANGGKYYFKMEKIKWRILDNIDGVYTIVADTNLQALAYQPTYTQDESYFYTTANGAPEGTYANNYKYSELRRFLNDDFMDFAFSEEQKALIQKNVEVDNSLASTGEETNSYVCENTFDDVWALSVADVYTHIGEAGSEALNSWIADLETSDYARATGALTVTLGLLGAESEEAAGEQAMFLGTGGTWLRSPDPADSNDAYVVNNYGFDNFYVYSPISGVLPAIQLHIN